MKPLSDERGPGFELVKTSRRPMGLTIKNHEDQVVKITASTRGTVGWSRVS